MGLSRATISKAVSGAFKALGDIPESATLRRSTITHSTSTGLNTTSDEDFTIGKAVFSKYEQFEIDKVFILSTDVKMLFQSSEISITPTSVTDTVIRNDIVHNIIRYSKDPSGTITSLQLRAP